MHVWSKLDHANILPLLGITTKFDWTVSIVSPWMENGNARDYVQDEAIDPRPLVSVHYGGGIHLNTTQIVGIAKGLHYLHNHKPNPIFHGDMKGVGRVTFRTQFLFDMIMLQVNVLISDNREALLTDFGYSVAVNSSFSMTISNQGGTKGTLRWMSPEILEGGEGSAEADVWAFGMTALVCRSLFHPRNVEGNPCRSSLRVRSLTVKSAKASPSQLGSLQEESQIVQVLKIHVTV